MLDKVLTGENVKVNGEIAGRRHILRTVYMWINIEKDTTEIVYDNKNLHITELEDTWPMFILFYLLVIKDNDPAVKI